MDIENIIKSIKPNAANLDYISKTGVINGTLRLDIERVMKLAYNQALEDAAKEWYYPLSGSNTKVVDLDNILSLKKH